MKIMFICTGNICRSAMADWLLKQKIKDKNIKDIEVYSCGVYAEDGDTPTWEAKRVMMDEYSIDISQHRATNIRNSNIEKMDLILCATSRHKRAVLGAYPELEGKVLKEYLWVYPPGIPLIIPGEIMSKDIINKIKTFLSVDIEVRTTYNKFPKIGVEK